MSDPGFEITVQSIKEKWERNKEKRQEIKNQMSMINDFMGQTAIGTRAVCGG